MGRKRKPFVWNGKEYESIDSAAQELYISPEGLYYRRRQGYTSDADMKTMGQNPKPVTLDGIVYASQREAARALGLTEAAIHYRVKRQKNH